MDLNTPLGDAGRTYKMYAGRLAKLDIFTIGDFLFHIPSRYDDFSRIAPITTLQEGEIVTVQGTVEEIRNEFTRGYKKIQKAVVKDATGSLAIIWFNQPYIVKSINHGDTISLSGRVEKNAGHLALISPEFEILSLKNPPIHTGRLVPIYPETKGVSSKWLRRQVYKIIHEFREKFTDHIPYSIVKSFGLVDYIQAIEQIHYPSSLAESEKAKERLAFDELFLLQLAARQRRTEWEQSLQGIVFQVEKYEKEIQQFWELLPFELTSAQRKVIHDIFLDVQKGKPMNRLVQGDVGSGKTVVAAVVAYLAFLNGYQSVLMAPTEILAGQHFTTLSNLFAPLGIKIALATGSKKTIKDDKDFHILVGTHAVLSEKVQFEKLGLVIIDEQQRFGVEQRTIIRQKGNNPHLLTMTATPIPRTVALTLYGDLDLSVIDEMPKGRQIVTTWLVPNQKRDAGYTWIAKQITENGDQAFIICPFIEESENMTTVKAATKEFERLKTDVFPNLTLGMLHGKMKGKEKDAILQDFKNKKFDILVATPVVEVGIDITNATIIVIEAAERFGLAGLHQLRGRVGRGNKKSYCLLFTESSNEMTRNRLTSLQTIHNGAELAELDLRLRGAGDLYGTQQSGYKMLKIASFSDLALIEKAKKAATEIFPNLNDYPILKEKVEEVTIKQVNPD